MNPRALTLRATLLLGTCLAGPAMAEGVLAQLYAPRPPAGSAFVRVVNPSADSLKVQISNGTVQAIGPSQLASSYAIVKGNETFSVTLDGKPAGQLQVAPDSFNTLVPQDGKLQVLDDSAGSDDALKAELRFYNLASDCPKGSLAVADGGPVLFADVAAHSTTARAINPVSASLSAGCGKATAEKLALPQLKPGDHYSLFLTGSATAPVLRGQLSSTDLYAK
ncbi:alginate O-acetyltransferase AlgF [Pseudomonas kielensis]|jgi:alginate O-acetyltransferase complex protein AlgF|uniref:alginate O-acetyltransferase AlgF n=1 Tax=Pseudomonas kielensis TaxID=2762577 RepID=UPI0015FABF17|nr:alginate O-acetyltransferase AlgF [Pseudomonas kielensis]WKL54745.1 alginate O-acetyltransferase AlgF [Pseudomonas kielensis]